MEDGKKAGSKTKTKKKATKHDTDSPRVKYKKGVKVFHYVSVAVSLLSLIGLGVLAFLSQKIIWIVLFIFLGVPLGLGSIFYGGIRAFLDRRKIKSAFVKKASGNFIVAKFFKEQGRTEDIALMLNADGRSFTYKKGLYMIDHETIYYDENRNPCAYYRFGFPNPLRLDFEKFETRAMEAVKNNETTVTDDSGNVIDISYSSISLEAFKKDKIFEDFHRDPGAQQLVFILLGLNALSFLAIILIVIFGGG